MTTSAVFEEQRAEISSRLPEHRQWLIHNTPLDWDFSRAKRRLQPIGAGEIGVATIPSEWQKLLIFGESDYAEGGGSKSYVCIHFDTGRVCGLDLDHDENSALYLFNSTVSQFIETFLLFDRALAKSTEAVSNLKEKGRTIDPGLFDHGEWKDLAEHIFPSP